MQKRAPRGAPWGAKGAQKVTSGIDGGVRLAHFGVPGPPKGLTILEKAVMLAANCRTAGLEGLEDWKPRI